ncbi:hydroxyacid dehydrogenase [Candidatus Woesearchaeota archaeon]|nr:hydroxyacid dehydrogenase [Candidatus Woesearchaeota archaeon]
MNIAFFEVEEWEKPIIQKALKGHTVSFFSAPLTKSNAAKIKNYDILSVFIYSKVNKDIIAQLPKLRFIATRSTGFDHIDMDTCKAKGIKVANVPTYGENTVAEHTFALILSLTRKIHKSYERTIRGDFTLEGLRGFDLKGKTIGVIGTGNIGRHVIRIANGFEMNTLAYDVRQDAKFARQMGFKYVPLANLLANSDIITLHVPYLKATHHLINRDNINKIKKGSILINTARGGLVETEALVIALDKGILAGAGLDVLEEEFFIKEETQLLSKQFPETCDLKTLLQNHILLKRDNVLITPHNAFNSNEALLRILETTLDNIAAFSKKKPINIVAN